MTYKRWLATRAPSGHAIRHAHSFPVACRWAPLLLLLPDAHCLTRTQDQLAIPISILQMQWIKCREWRVAIAVDDQSGVRSPQRFQRSQSIASAGAKAAKDAIQVPDM